MDEILKRLEGQIRKLVEQYGHLKKSNQYLNQGKFLLAREKDGLVEKQQQAIKQIESLISQLKAIEKLP